MEEQSILDQLSNKSREIHGNQISVLVDTPKKQLIKKLREDIKTILLGGANVSGIQKEPTLVIDQ